MSKRISITFTDEQVNMIERIARKEDKSFADTVRFLCDESLKIQANTDNIDMIVDIIDEQLRAIMKPHVERLAALSAKGAIMSATSTFLNAQALADFVPVYKRKDLVEVYEKARLKGVAYVKGRVSDSEKEVQEAIKKEVKHNTINE